MTNQQATSSPTGTRQRTLTFVVCCYLIATFLWRAIVPAHEYPMRPEQVLSITLDLLAVIGLIGMRAHVVKWLFWVALLAGLSLFAIRLNGDASWWTGHLVYTLSPR